MKLLGLTVRRMPGIDRPFRVEELADGLNLVVGPNGSGKTTLCRAVRALLWPGEVAVEPVSLAGEWEDEGTALRVEREGGRTRWQREGLDDEGPGLPAGRFARCFVLGVRDLMLEGRPTDAALATEIRSQLTGGYDVGALLDGSFAERPREGQAEDKKIRELQQGLRDLRSKSAALADDEERKLDKEKELARAREAGERLRQLRTARDVASARAALERVRNELTALPPGMERIRGGEEGQLEQVETDLEEARERVAACRRSREDAERRIEASPLSGGLVQESDLKAWLDRARDLQRLEGERSQAEESRARAEARRENARRALSPDGSAAPPARLGPEELTKIELFLLRADDLRARRLALEAERRLLGETREGPAASRRQIERGIEALEGWLSADALRGQVRSGWALPSALVALLAGAAVGLLAHWSGWVLCGAGLGGLLLLLWLRTRVKAPGQDRLDFETLGLDGPEAWESERVRDRLSELRDAADESRRDEGLAERRSALEGNLAGLAEAEAELEADRDQLRSALGVDPGAGDLGLATLASRVRAYHEADEECGSSMGHLESLGTRHAEALARINGFLDGSGLEESADAAGLIRRLEELGERVTALLEARKEREAETARETGLLHDVEKLERRLEEIFRSAGLEPDDREGLESRLRELERYRDLRSREDRHHEDVEQGTLALAGRDDLLERSHEALEAEIARWEESASRIEELSRTVGSIDRKVREARADDAVERQMARLAAARQELADRLEEKLQRAAGAFLLRSILDEYEHATRPEVLSRAIESFARFTRHEYELIFDSRGGAEGFRAVESSTGEGRGLSELSDGTRIQLLLAARLAFATRADRQRRVPLFLDEVLTTSDPARFAAVARSLLVLVREEGRQVFYLTSNPADAARWREFLEPEERGSFRVVDLAKERGLAGAANEIAEIEVPPLPEPPSPEGLSAAEYGLAIGAAPVEPHRPVEGLHLIHLLHDDLALLYLLLQKGISTLGQWRSLTNLGEGAINLGEGARLAGGERAGRLSALGDLAEAFFASWAVGRGRRVDPDALRGADGVTEAFRERLVELADELAGDATRLVRVLEERADPRVSGFREKKLEELRNWLIGEGYLDTREPLDAPALQARVLEALSSHLGAGRLSTSDVAAHVHRLFTLAEMGSRKKAGASGAGGGRETPEAP